MSVDHNDPHLDTSSTSSYAAIPTCSLDDYNPEIRVFLNFKTFLLGIIFTAQGVFMTSFSAFFPTEVGKILPIHYVSMFGMVVGVGQIIGALGAGWLLKHISVNLTSVLIMLVGVLTMVYSGFVIELDVPFIAPSPLLAPHYPYIIIIAVLLGVLNAGNSVNVSTIITLKYAGHSAKAYSGYILVCSVAMILFNFVITVLPVFYVLCLFTSALAASFAGGVIMLICNY